MITAVFYLGVIAGLLLLGEAIRVGIKNNAAKAIISAFVWSLGISTLCWLGYKLSLYLWSLELLGTKVLGSAIMIGSAITLIVVLDYQYYRIKHAIKQLKNK